MPLGNHILASVRRQVSLEPDLLGRPNATAAGHELALTVEIDNMPVAPGDVVAVVAFATCIGRVGAVIAKVAVEVLGSTRPQSWLPGTGRVRDRTDGLPQGVVA